MRAVIFDLDGTLWDASASIAESWSQVLKDNQYEPVTANQVKGLCGQPMDAILRALAPGADMSLLDELCLLEEQNLHHDHGVLYPGISELLEKLSEGYELYIVSNCQKGYIEIFLETMDLADYFKDFDCWGNTLSPKGVTLKGLIERNGIEQAVYVGDTKGDQAAAKYAGIPFIHAAYGFARTEGADAVINEPLELLEHLDKFF